MVDIEGTLAGLGYPDRKQSAVWFPFLLEPSYEPADRDSCQTFLVFKRGLPKVLVCPGTSLEQYKELALDTSVFHRAPPVLIGYNLDTLTASACKQGTYSTLETVPTWDQLEDYDSGCLSEERAEKEILAVRNRMSRWLQDPFSEAAVQGLMRVHVQRGAIVQELIQNACDCLATRITFNLDNDTLVFRHDGHPFMPENVHAITALNVSCKPPGAIGYKGIGFKAVYQVCRRPEVMSWPFRFAFEPRKEDLAKALQGMLCPYLPVPNKQSEYPPDGVTEFRLPLVEGQKDSIIDSLRAVTGAMLLFMAAKGLSLRSMQILDHHIELPPGHSLQEGAVSVLDNRSPSYWFISGHEFTVDMDRQSALIDFSNTTSRIDFRDQPAKEHVVVAVPLSADPSGQLIPDASHNGRFYSFLPTKDVYRYPLDINANFLVDEARDHLRFPAQGSWNEALLHECGNALLSLLDAAKKTWENDHGFPVSDYYNLIPRWDEAVADPQFSSHFELMEKTFSTNFRNEPRVPVHVGDSLSFVTPDKSLLMQSDVRPLFPLKTWLRFLPTGKALVSYELDDDIWQGFLLGKSNGSSLYDAGTLIVALHNKEWLDLVSVEAGSAEVVPLIGRLCSYLAICGISQTDLAFAWIIPSSTQRELYRPDDRPHGKPIYRMPDDGMPSLLPYVIESTVVAHDGVLRFLQHDPSYFKGNLVAGITDQMAFKGRALWTSLSATLDFGQVISDWLNRDFQSDSDSIEGIGNLRDEWLRFLLRNRDRLTPAVTSILKLRLLARQNGTEGWTSPEKVWLFDACPQGRDVEDFFAQTLGVALLSMHYASVFAGSKDVDEATIGAFFIRLGVQHTIGVNRRTIGWYDPDRQTDEFCQDLGIPPESGPRGDINYSMAVHDYSLPEDIVSALNDSLIDAVPHRRLIRLRAFAAMIQKAWAGELSKKCFKEGVYHIKGAYEWSEMAGELSEAALTLRDTEWIPLASDPGVLKRPRETCLPTEENIGYADLKVKANYADIWLEDRSLIDFLGFQPFPVELSSLDAIRAFARSWEDSTDPRADFESLYHRLSFHLDQTIRVEEAQTAFRQERLIYVPVKPPLRSSEEVLVNADARFKDFLDELSDYYPAAICALFRRLGVSDKVQDIHYLRYLVSYIWQEKPSITDLRRETILKAYRRLVEWAKDQPGEEGIWASPEGKVFAQSTIFYGVCAGKDGWYPANQKTIVYRDDPQIEAVLADKHEYVLESHLQQLRRNLDDLEPFLTRFHVKTASRLAIRKVVTSADSTVLDTSSNLRQNIFTVADVLGRRLEAALPKNLSDEFRGCLFASKTRQWQSMAINAELIHSGVIQIEFPELMSPGDKPTSCDAAIDVRADTISLLISSYRCMDVSPAIGREMKQVLRTDTLSEDVRLRVERLIEDIAGWLDLSPDACQRRFAELLIRHLPMLASEGSASILEESGDIGGSGATPAQADTPSETPSPGRNGEPPESGGGQILSPSPIKMPDFNSQKVTLTVHSSQDFTIITEQPSPGSITPHLRTKRRPRLSEEQRQQIGRRAELIVLNDERNRLETMGHPELVPRVVDRNEAGYDPDGPYDIDSVEQDERGDWKPIKIEVKGHLDPDVWGFELSRPELETALNDLGSTYYVYLVLNLRDVDVQVHKLNFRGLWQEKRLNYRAKRIDITLRPA